MDSKIDLEYLRSLSLFDLYEMANFYETFQHADYADWSAFSAKPDVDTHMCIDRIKLLSTAIRLKKCEMDERLFGSSIIRNLNDFSEKSYLDSNSQKHI